MSPFSWEEPQEAPRPSIRGPSNGASDASRFSLEPRTGKDPQISSHNRGWHGCHKQMARPRRPEGLEQDSMGRGTSLRASRMGVTTQGGPSALTLSMQTNPTNSVCVCVCVCVSEGTLQSQRLSLYHLCGLYPPKRIQFSYRRMKTT